MEPAPPQGASAATGSQRRRREPGATEPREEGIQHRRINPITSAAAASLRTSAAASLRTADSIAAPPIVGVAASPRRGLSPRHGFSATRLLCPAPSTPPVSNINEEEEDGYITPEDYYVEPEDDYLSPEDSYISDDDDYFSDVEFDEKTQIILRGPGYIGIESFDKYCIFGNFMDLNFHQTMILRSHVEDLPRPELKEYVSTLTRSMVLPGEAYSEFTKEYTSTYLVKFMMDQQAIRYGVPVRSKVMSVAVCSTTSTETKYCRLGLDVSDKGIIQAPGWSAAVKAFNLREGDVAMFSFKDESKLPRARRPDFGTIYRLVILKLEAEA